MLSALLRRLTYYGAQAQERLPAHPNSDQQYGSMLRRDHSTS
ncbi:MAG: hypothetical protein ACR5LD_01640 [Symbiopectobacterium sp.]